MRFDYEILSVSRNDRLTDRLADRPKLQNSEIDSSSN